MRARHSFLPLAPFSQHALGKAAHSRALQRVAEPPSAPQYGPRLSDRNHAAGGFGSGNIAGAGSSREGAGGGKGRRSRGPARYLASPSALSAGSGSGASHDDDDEAGAPLPLPLPWPSPSAVQLALPPLIAPAPEGLHAWPLVVHARRRTDTSTPT